MRAARALLCAAPVPDVHGPAAAATPLAEYRPRRPEATVLHQLVREHLRTFLASVELPRRVAREFMRYLDCGMLPRGFARVRCDACGRDLLVGFSCKARLCPSCNARRMHDTAAHLADRVLPRARYRQWVLSVPHRVRYLLARHPEVASRALRLFLRGLFAFHRLRARRLGHRGQPGAVTFIQRFGGALNLNVHFHALVPDAVFTPDPVALPPPTDEEISALVAKIARHVLRLLEKRGLLGEDPEPEDVLATLQAEAVQGSLPLHLDAERPPRHRRAGFHDGFSLHAGVALHPNDREGLERLCRYGARPPFASERLSLLADGSACYRLKRPVGTTLFLVLDPVRFLRRLASLLPPRRFHLVRISRRLRPQREDAQAPATSPRGLARASTGPLRRRAGAAPSTPSPATTRARRAAPARPRPRRPRSRRSAPAGSIGPRC